MVLKRHDGRTAPRHHSHRSAPRPRRPLNTARMVNAASIPPSQAAQPQCGHHSATVVQTSISGPSQQQMLFYSSVQCRGGVFTKTAQETKAQLARTGVLPTSTAYRKRARAAEEAVTGKPSTVKSRFADIQTAKAKEELRKANAIVSKSGAGRFTLDDGEFEESKIV